MAKFVKMTGQVVLHGSEGGQFAISFDGQRVPFEYKDVPLYIAEQVEKAIKCLRDEATEKKLADAEKELAETKAKLELNSKPVTDQVGQVEVVPPKARKSKAY